MKQLINLTVFFTLAVLTGCSTTTSTIDDGSFKRVVPNSQKEEIVFGQFEEPVPDNPVIKVELVRVQESLRETVQIKRVEENTELNLFGKSLITPLALPLAVISFGQVNLWGEQVSELERKENITNEEVVEHMRPAHNVQVRLLWNGKQVVEYTNQSGIAQFDVREIVKTAFEDVSVNNLTLSVEFMDKVRKTVIDSASLQAIYVEL